MNQPTDFRFTTKALEELDQLQTMTGLPNRGEVIRHALKLFAWLNERQAQGYILLIEKDDKTEEVEFPFWKNG